MTPIWNRWECPTCEVYESRQMVPPDCFVCGLPMIPTLGRRKPTDPPFVNPVLALMAGTSPEGDT